MKEHLKKDDAMFRSYKNRNCKKLIEMLMFLKHKCANTTLGEAGLFNSSSVGTMLSRVTFATIDKTTFIFNGLQRLLSWSQRLVTDVVKLFLIDSNPFNKATRANLNWALNE